MYEPVYRVQYKYEKKITGQIKIVIEIADAIHIDEEM